MKHSNTSPILDSSGSPMVRASGYARPYAAADMQSAELANWRPSIDSADSSYLYDRDTIVSRARDLARNSGWASGAVTRHLDNVIGTGFRLAYKPDYRALGLDAAFAADFENEVEGRWRIFAEDPDNWIDATRHENFNGLLSLAYRHDFVDGESFTIALWNENKPYGRYATTLQLVDTDLVSNPGGLADSEFMRSGVELDDYGAAIAYHFRQGHPSEYFSSGNSFVWERVDRELPWGRRQVIHTFARDRAGQTRGITRLAPVIERLKMIDRYDRVELQAALVNAIFAAFIESPFDHDLLDEALTENTAQKYQDARTAFHKEANITLEGGVRIPKLFPGEQFKFQAASRPSNTFSAFEAACLRNIAAGTGLSYEQLSQDWSKTNYSSARAALLEVWRYLGRTRKRFADQFATPVFALWLEEAINRGDIVLPEGAPDFYTAKPAWCRCFWIGQGRGWIDPVKEAVASQMRMDMGISTLEEECAEQGKDYEDVLFQRKREVDLIDKLGLPRPEWAQKMAVNINSESETKPQGEKEDA